MLKLNSSTDKPNHELAVQIIEASLKEGIKINVEELNKKIEGCHEEYEKCSKKIYEKYGVANVNSTRQVAELLKRESHKIAQQGLSRNDVYEISYDQRNGKFSTRKEVLLKLEALGYEFASDILDAKRASKNYSVLKGYRDFTGSDECVHPTVSVTKTHRIGLQKPSLMTIRKSLRWKIFKQRSEDMEIVCADIKNEELTILFNEIHATECFDDLLSEEGIYNSTLKKLYSPKAQLVIRIDPSFESRVIEDFEDAVMVDLEHDFDRWIKVKSSACKLDGLKVEAIKTLCFVAKSMSDAKVPTEVEIALNDGENTKVVKTPVKWKKIISKDGDKYVFEGELPEVSMDIDPEERKEIKFMFIASIYGISEMGMRETVKHLDIPTFTSFFKSIGEYSRYAKEANRMARDKCKHTYTKFGTKIELEKWELNESGLARKFMNYPVQGTGADVMAFILENADRVIKEKYDGKIKIYFSVYDEVVFEVNKQWMKEVGRDKVSEILKDLVEFQIDDGCPARAEIKFIADEVETDSDEELFLETEE